MLLFLELWVQIKLILEIIEKELKFVSLKSFLREQIILLYKKYRYKDDRGLIKI